MQGFWDGAYGLSSLSEKTRNSNRLQMSLQRQHFLHSYGEDWQTGAYATELTGGGNFAPQIFCYNLQLASSTYPKDHLN